MVSFPLGLRAKLYIKPWATIAIAVLTLGLSIKSLMALSSTEHFKAQVFAKYQVHERTYKAMGTSCKASFDDFACDFLHRNVKAEDLARSEHIIQLIEQFQAFDRVTKDNLKNYIKNLPAKLNAQSAQFSHLKSFKEYTVAVQAAQQEIEQYFSEKNMLSKNNLNWKSFSLAQFMHNNWWTLLANLLILGLFAVYLEQRVGPAFLVLIYFIGGSVATGLQANFLGPYQITAGAVGNVMAMIGAYAFFFFKEKIHISKELEAPVWLFAGIIAVLGNIFYTDKSLSLNPVLLANLAGLTSGLVCGFISSLIVWVQKDFLFSQEQILFFNAKKTSQPLKKINWALAVLEINPYNFIAVEYIFRSLLKYNVEALSIPKPALTKICHLIFRLINQEFRVNPKEAYAIIGLIPLAWNFSELPMPRIKKQVLNKIGNDILEHEWCLAIRLYDLFLKQNIDPGLTESIKLTVQKIILNAESPLNQESHQNVEWLRRYVIFNSQTVLGQMIGEKYAEKTAASA